MNGLSRDCHCLLERGYYKLRVFLKYVVIKIRPGAVCLKFSRVHRDKPVNINKAAGNSFPEIRWYREVMLRPFNRTKLFCYKLKGTQKGEKFERGYSNERSAEFHKGTSYKTT